MSPEAIQRDSLDLRRAGVLVLGVFGLWLLLGTFLGIQMYLNSPATGPELSLRAALEMSIRRYLVYALLTFPVLWLCRRFAFTSGRFMVSLLAHGVGVAAFTVLFAPVRMLFGTPINRQTLERAPLSLETAKNLIRSNLFEQFWMYTSIVTAALAIQYYRQSRQRELRENELKRQMAEHELHVLKLQLQPHFLFNTLNGISTLMARDARTAREMLVRLSELLRIALSHSADHEVSFREEIEFVKAYLELEQMRFGDRLKVRLDLDPGTLDARVPNMLIQPLVENAIQYGIAQIRSGGTLDLAASKNGGTLHLRIANDGPAEAMEAQQTRGTGLGLSNTRARLWRLYGDAYRLQMESRPSGGIELRLEIPFRTTAAAAGPR